MLIKTTHPVQAPAQSRCCLVAKSLRLFATPWTVAHQAPLSMGFPRQEYWPGLPFPPPGDLPDPGVEPDSPALAGSFFTTELCGKPPKTELPPNSVSDGCSLSPPQYLC